MKATDNFHSATSASTSTRYSWIYAPQTPMSAIPFNGNFRFVRRSITNVMDKCENESDNRLSIILFFFFRNRWKFQKIIIGNNLLGAVVTLKSAPADERMGSRQNVMWMWTHGIRLPNLCHGWGSTVAFRPPRRLTIRTGLSSLLLPCFVVRSPLCASAKHPRQLIGERIREKFFFLQKQKQSDVEAYCGYEAND